MMPELTRRETQALTLLALGCSNRLIAQKLNIALPTVAMHLQSARRRLNAKSREQAVAIAVASGLISVIQSSDRRSVGVDPVRGLSALRQRAARGCNCGQLG